MDYESHFTPRFIISVNMFVFIYIITSSHTPLTPPPTQNMLYSCFCLVFLSDSLSVYLSHCGHSVCFLCLTVQSSALQLDWFLLFCWIAELDWNLHVYWNTTRRAGRRASGRKWRVLTLELQKVGIGGALGVLGLESPAAEGHQKPGTCEGRDW